MEQSELLLRTAFACMSCDGDIASEEVELIKQMSKEKQLFGEVDIDKELDELVSEINLKGKGFLKQYLQSLAEESLTEEQELKVADVAVQTIRADNRIEYSEIKFFKVLRSNLKIVSDETLLEKIDGIDENYLAQDIQADYLQMYDDYFSTIELPKFEILKQDFKSVGS
ncbi:MAG: TerB family tellurite resistance protein [Prevotella sp.]|nr:TerB family tellurite resistance protein [Prevotella sp.]